jgi:5-methylcytosine-specific restriction endonuclease McrA
MYGDSCVCCGIKDFEVLTLDHINNDGKADRMLHGAGSSFIKYLSKIPKRNDLQLLCWNCNRKKELMNRIPVYHKDGTRISNTTEARARKLIKNKQAVAVENASTFSIKMIVDTRKN